jgi:hypothetical protein
MKSPSLGTLAGQLEQEINLCGRCSTTIGFPCGIRFCEGVAFRRQRLELQNAGESADSATE